VIVPESGRGVNASGSGAAIPSPPPQWGWRRAPDPST